MSSIEDAIKQLEASSSNLKQMSIEESRAIRDAVKQATKVATEKVKAEFKEKKTAARLEAKEAEKSVKDAQARIQKALGAESEATFTRTRAPKGLREKQFVDYVQSNPGSNLANIARGIGIQSSAVNGIAQKAVAEGKVKKADDKTYTAA